MFLFYEWLYLQSFIDTGYYTSMLGLAFRLVLLAENHVYKFLKDSDYSRVLLETNLLEDAPKICLVEGIG